MIRLIFYKDYSGGKSEVGLEWIKESRSNDEAETKTGQWTL